MVYSVKFKGRKLFVDKIKKREYNKTNLFKRKIQKMIKIIMFILIFLFVKKWTIKRLSKKIKTNKIK